MRAPVLLSLLALATVACDDTEVVDFQPASVVDKLRVLGVRADPPELVPGQTTLLSALVADPKEGLRPVSMVWLLCDPAPEDALGNVCARQDTLRTLDPDKMPEGVRIVPFFVAPYTAPSTVLDTLEPDSVARRRGLSATIMLIVFEGESLDDLKDPNLQKVAVIKRIRIADPTDKPNRNPNIADVTLAGTSIDRIDTPAAKAGSSIDLAATADPDAAQEFVRVMPDGSEVTQQEQVVFSWFTMDGHFEEGLTEYASRTPDGKPIRLALPTREQAKRDYVEFFVVLRDARGGIDWARRLVRLE